MAQDTAPTQEERVGRPSRQLHLHTLGARQAIQTLPAMEGLDDASLSAAGYGDVLVGFARFSCAWERTVLDVDQIDPWALTRAVRRRRNVEADLAQLGVDAPESSTELAQSLTAELNGRPEILGALFAVERTALDGGQIAHRLDERDATWPTRFFRGDGADLSLDWRKFQARLDAELLGHGPSIERAARMATATFRKLGQCVTEVYLEATADR